MPPTTRRTANVGATVRAEMARRRVTMVELSKRTGVPRSTLAYQVNSDCLTAHNLLAVAKALGVAVTKLTAA